VRSTCCHAAGRPTVICAARWALEAFRFSLRRDIAQPKLQAVSAGLKFADTRQAAAELLQHWQKVKAAISS